MVWNPWVDKAKETPDFGDDEYPNMVCVESGHVSSPVILLPGTAFEASQILQVMWAEGPRRGGMPAAGPAPRGVRVQPLAAVAAPPEPTPAAAAAPGYGWLALNSIYSEMFVPGAPTPRRFLLEGAAAAALHSKDEPCNQPANCSICSLNL